MNARDALAAALHEAAGRRPNGTLRTKLYPGPALADRILAALSGWSLVETPEIERLREVGRAARLRRNVSFIGTDMPALTGEWVAVPKADFDALRAALEAKP